ncbi:MAG: hypothetical protein CML02_12990 [Pseudooceanicola sp.]|nr:hypothetical protein [Pseudooceanicola sp.]
MMTSTPAPPSRMSLPSLPSSRSLPPRPLIVSLPPSPLMRSVSSVPFRMSSPAVPFWSAIGLSSAFARNAQPDRPDCRWVGWIGAMVQNQQNIFCIGA